MDERTAQVTEDEGYVPPAAHDVATDDAPSVTAAGVQSGVIVDAG